MTPTPHGEEKWTKGLNDARNALLSLPQGVFGYRSQEVMRSEVGPDIEAWPIRAELLAKIDKALAKARGQS